MVAYAVSKSKAVLLGEVLKIERAGDKDKYWAGGFKYIIDIKEDDDNGRIKRMLWRGSNDPFMSLVMLNVGPITD